MERHAFSEDNQLGFMGGNEFLTRCHIDFKGIFGENREIDHRRFFSHGVAGDKIPQCAHGLCAEVSAFDNMVVHHFPHASLLLLAIGPVNVIHNGAKQGGVGHLTGHQTGFNV